MVIIVFFCTIMHYKDVEYFKREEMDIIFNYCIIFVYEKANMEEF